MQHPAGPGLESHPLDTADPTSSPESLLEPELSDTSPTRRRSKGPNHQQFTAASVDFADLVRDFNTLSARCKASEQQLEQTRRELSKERQRGRRLRASYDALALSNLHLGQQLQQHKGSSSSSAGSQASQSQHEALQVRSSGQHALTGTGKPGRAALSEAGSSSMLPAALGPLQAGLLERCAAAAAAADRHSRAAKDTAVADQGRSSNTADTVGDRAAGDAAGACAAAAAATAADTAAAVADAGAVTGPGEAASGSLVGAAEDAGAGAISEGSSKMLSPKKRTAGEGRQQPSAGAGGSGSSGSAAGMPKKQALPQAVGDMSKQQQQQPAVAVAAPLCVDVAADTAEEPVSARAVGAAGVAGGAAVGDDSSNAGWRQQQQQQQQQQQARALSKRLARQAEVLSSDHRLAKMARRLSRARSIEQAGAGAGIASILGDSSTGESSSAAAAAAEFEGATDAAQQQPTAKGFRVSLKNAVRDGTPLGTLSEEGCAAPAAQGPTKSGGSSSSGGSTGSGEAGLHEAVAASPASAAALGPVGDAAAHVEQPAGKQNSGSSFKRSRLSAAADCKALTLVATPAGSSSSSSSRHSFDEPSKQHSAHAAPRRYPYARGGGSGSGSGSTGACAAEPRHMSSEPAAREGRQPAPRQVPQPAPAAAAAAPHAGSAKAPDTNSSGSSSHSISKGSSKWSAAKAAKAVVVKVRSMFAGMGSGVPSSDGQSAAGGSTPAAHQGVGSSSSAGSHTGGGAGRTNSSRGEGDSWGSSRFYSRRQDADFRRSWQGPFFSSGGAAVKAEQQQSTRCSKDDLHAGGSNGAKRWLRSRLKWAHRLGGDDSDSSSEADDAAPVYEEDPFGPTFSPLRANFRQKVPQGKQQGPGDEAAEAQHPFADPFGPAFSPLRRSMQSQPGAQQGSSQQGQRMAGAQQHGTAAAEQEDHGFGPGWLGID